MAIFYETNSIKYKNALYYEQYEYTTTKTMEHLLNPVTVFGEKAIIEMDDKRKNIPVIPNSRYVCLRMEWNKSQ